MSVADEFNFEMTTEYKPEFKNLITYKKLYKILAQEYMASEGIKLKDDENYDDFIEDKTFGIRDMIVGKDKSSIRSKLKNQLHLDIKAYADKGDEEKFDVLKLLYFIANTKQHKGQDSDKTVSVINLIAKSSLEHIDADNAVYKELFKSIVEGIRSVVNHADKREETVDWIHGLWEQVHVNIGLTVLEEIQMPQNTLQKINERLKSVLGFLNKDKINQLQRLNESIIDTFYNMLISSRIIAEIEDMKQVTYDYQKEETVPQTVTDLFLEDMFSEIVTWKEFQAVTDIKKADLSEEKVRKIWSLLLCKTNVSDEDLQEISLPDYRFAMKYAETVAEYWTKTVLKHNSVTLGEWIIVMQELMCIHHDKIKYQNCFIRYTNKNVQLTASVKSFEEASELPHLIVMNRLTNRLLLTYGTKELFEQKLQADRYIMEIEKIIFSYKNIEDIRTAHNYLYFQVISFLATDFSCSDIPVKMNQIMQNQLMEKGLPPIVLTFESNTYAQFDFLMHILAQDKYFRLIQDNEFMNLRKDALYALSCGTEEFLKFAVNHRNFAYPEFACEMTAKLFAEEIEYMVKNSILYSRPIIIPIYFGEGNEYNLQVNFVLVQQFIIISQINFILCSISNSSKNEHLRFENEKKAVKQVYLCNEYVQCR